MGRLGASHGRGQVERLTATLASVRADADEDKERLEHEAAQVKSMYRTALDDNTAATAALTAAHAAVGGAAPAGCVCSVCEGCVCILLCKPAERVQLHVAGGGTVWTSCAVVLDGCVCSAVLLWVTVLCGRWALQREAQLQADLAQCETDKAILEKYAKIGEAHAALAETAASGTAPRPPPAPCHTHTGGVQLIARQTCAPTATIIRTSSATIMCIP